MAATRVDRSALIRLAFAHHPTCFLFREDTFRVGRFAFCVGCTVAWPTIFVAAVVLWNFGQVAGWLTWFVVGWILGAVQFVSVAGLARSRASKALVKLALGLGLASTLYAVVEAPWAAPAKFAFLVFGTLLGGIALWPKARRLLATCDACIHHRDWENCPGMHIVTARTSTRS